MSDLLNDKWKSLEQLKDELVNLKFETANIFNFRVALIAICQKITESMYSLPNTQVVISLTEEYLAIVNIYLASQHQLDIQSFDEIKQDALLIIDKVINLLAGSIC